MPRTADHDARRRQLADAVRALAAEFSFEQVTVARVAERAGFSVGLVQHYFPSKDELLLHTYRETTRATLARVDERIAEGDRRQQPIRTLLLDAFAEALPLDDHRRAEHRVNQAFLGRALDNPALAAVAVENATGLRQAVATAVDNGKKCGEVVSDMDAGRTALSLLAALDGLASRLYHEPETVVSGSAMPQAALAVLHERVGEVFTGRCHHYDT